jgi:hypothetical protein
MFTSASYKPLVNVLQALRAHDETALELLAVPQEGRRTPGRPSTDIGPAPREGQAESRILLRFSTPRDPVLVARWITYQVIDTERQDWERGLAAATAYHRREHQLRVPFDHREGEAGKAYPLGHWISEQRKAYSAGQLTGRRVERLEDIGMLWDPLDSAFEENLAACRVYFAEHGTLAAPRTATALDKPLGQWLSNQRRPGVLAGRPDRVAALAAIDPDWNPDWPLDWQRHFAAVRECVDGGARPADLVPGVTVNGYDIGRWLERQRRHTSWEALLPEQRERLARLGVRPQPAAAGKAAVRGRSGGAGKPSAFDRGLAALARYQSRTGSVTVPRGHVEQLPDSASGGPAEVKLGIWLSNTRTRRNRLTAQQLDRLAELGLDWR